MLDTYLYSFATHSATFVSVVRLKLVAAVIYRSLETMSGRCCVDPGAKQTHETQGRETTIAELDTYETGQGKSVIVIFTDIFGFSFINTRKLADTVAQATGAKVLVPDLFYGDPLDPTAQNLFEKLPAWLQKHPVDQACANADKFISAINEHYESIQVNACMAPVVFSSVIFSRSLFFAGNWFLLRC